MTNATPIIEYCIYALSIGMEALSLYTLLQSNIPLTVTIILGILGMICVYAIAHRSQHKKLASMMRLISAALLFALAYLYTLAYLLPLLSKTSGV